MRKLFVIVLIATVAIVSVPLRANAAEPRVLTPSEAALVAQNCVVAQGSMQRLGNSDLATRVTRGRVYDYLLTKLIAPLNSRVTLNRYDATSLVTTTTNIEAKFVQFKQDYTRYETVLNTVVAFDCRAHPQEFYAQLENARIERAKVSTDIKDLDGLFSEYQLGLDKLISLVPEGR